MKKIVFALTALFFSLAVSQHLNGQDPRCKGWQDDLDKAEKKAADIKAKREALQEFITLMDDPESGLRTVQEEIASAEAAAKALQAKITAGDKSPESATELKSLRSRISLMKLRTSGTIDDATFFKNTEYKQHEKNLYSLKQEETSATGDAESIVSEMRENKCPIARLKNPGDLPEIELEGSWAGNWKWTDPNQARMAMVMGLNGTGSSVAGTNKLMIEDEVSATYTVQSCKEVGPNRLRCNFTGVMEDDEKFLDLAGTVDMTLSGSTLNTIWTEIGQPKIRWKAKERQVTNRAPAVMPITFKKE